MRGKKCVLMLTLMFLLGALIASVPPVKSEPYQYRLRIRESPPGSWVPGVPVQSGPPGEVWVIVDIETPIEYDNTSLGIVGYRFSVQVDPAVLQVIDAYAESLGYFLYDFIDWNYMGSDYYPELLVEKKNATTGTMSGIGELIKGFPELGVGAGGNSNTTGWYGATYGCTRLRFKSLSETAHTRIDIYDAYWVDMNETEHAFDVVEDGHYNDPGFLYLHSQSSLIDLSSPVTSSWHELYPGYSNVSSLNDWVDRDASGLSPGDYIQLNATWYLVEEVTVTIETRTAYGVGYNSTNSPSYTSVVAEGGWDTPENAFSSNNAYAVTNTKNAVQEYGNYSFSIPAGSTVTKVEVGYEAHQQDGTDGLGLNITWDGGTSWGTKYVASSLPTSDPETVTWVDFTGNTSWTISKLSNANFKVHVSYEYTGGKKTTWLDWVPARVTYISPLPLYIDYVVGFDYMDEVIDNPNNTMWHEIYPVFSNKFYHQLYNLTGLDDDDASGNLTIGDYIYLKNATGGTNMHYVIDLDTDIVISGPIEAPPEFPLGLAVEIGLIVAIAYVWWRSRRKTKTTKVTKQPKLAY